MKTPSKRAKTKGTKENIEQVEQMMDNPETFLVRCLAPKLFSSPFTVWKQFWYDWKLNIYRQSVVQPLPGAHKDQQRQFIAWILEQPACFVQKTIWTEENYFVLHARSNCNKVELWCTIWTYMKMLKHLFAMIWK